MLHPDVDHLIVVIDHAFPWSQVRVWAPAAKGNTWPHVEDHGALCLPTLKISVPFADRVRDSLLKAYELLCLPEDRRREDFAREFVPYWGRSVAGKKAGPLVISLLTPMADGRDAFFYSDHTSNQIIVAEQKEQLLTWLRNSGRNPGTKQIRRTLVLGLTAPLLPSEYPESGSDLITKFSNVNWETYIEPGYPLPVILAARTHTGVVFAGVVLAGAPQKDLSRGFRNSSKIPFTRVLQSFAGRQVLRCRVERADRAWVHGRDHDPDSEILSRKSVAIIGCGSLGASIAVHLAQAGVGKFLLIDFDDFHIHNTSRHVLGANAFGKRKVVALREMLQRHFPHIGSVDSFPHRIENLNANDLAQIAKADLIVSSGLDLKGDIFIDRWRRSLSPSPIHICAWVEEFALAGHAMAIFGTDSIESAFDMNALPSFRMTEWADAKDTQFVEAGCGNVFQPHGGVDLGASVLLTSGLAIDVLLEKVCASRRRAWLGSRDAVIAKGGTPLSAFSDSNVVRAFEWP